MPYFCFSVNPADSVIVHLVSFPNEGFSGLSGIHISKDLCVCVPLIKMFQCKIILWHFHCSWRKMSVSGVWWVFPSVDV